ncbi:MAG: efflux RND transporter periplasmic adaptor subunit [Steroidobacteraceae bacterium]
MRIASRIGIALLVAAGVAFLAWQRWAPTRVNTTLPERGTAVDAVYATGLVEPTLEIRIAPRAAGRLVSLAVDEGDRVNKGQVLARLEDEDQRSAVAELEARADYARGVFERNKELRATGLISKDSLDRTNADYEAAKATLNRAREQLRYLTLTAPAAGTIIRRDGEIGEYIPVNTTLFYMAGSTSLRVTADVDEEDLPRLQVGQKVLLRADAFAQQVFAAAVSEITPRGDPVARSYRVRIALGDDTPLRIGMTAEANIIVGERSNAMLVPATSVLNDHVFVVLDGRARSRAVQVGVRGPDKLEILEGLKDKERIVVAPDENLRDGARVRHAAGATAAP